MVGAGEGMVGEGERNGMGRVGGSCYRVATCRGESVKGR